MTLRSFVMAFATVSAITAHTPVQSAVVTPQKGNDASIDRLVGATRAVCDDPETFGYSVGGVAKVGASATIPKLLGKLFSFGLSGSVEAAGEKHQGISQKDVGGLRIAQVHCRENVFSDLNRRGTFTDLSTGRRVPKVINPVAYYRSHEAPSPQSQIDNNVVGNGSTFVGGSVGGNVTVYNGSQSGAITNKDKIIALATFIKEANAIEQGFANTNDVEAVKQGYADWNSRVDAYLTASFDPSYSATFESASGDAMGMAGRSVEGNGYWSLLRAKNTILTNAVAELRR